MSQLQVLVDTGVLVAIYDGADRYHQSSDSVFR
jgi:predicted nucleic acid-binding protein